MNMIVGDCYHIFTFRYKWHLEDLFEMQKQNKPIIDPGQFACALDLNRMLTVLSECLGNIFIGTIQIVLCPDYKRL